jgi:hypothetical protein
MRHEEAKPGDEERVEGRKRGPEVFGDLTPGGAQGGRLPSTAVLECPFGGRRRSDEVAVS